LRAQLLRRSKKEGLVMIVVLVYNRKIG
jgi:hypothetical protein